MPWIIRRYNRHDWYVSVEAALTLLRGDSRKEFDEWVDREILSDSEAVYYWPGWVDIFESHPPKRPIPNQLRQYVFRRDGYACCQCGSTQHLSADHVRPEIRGGQAIPTNLQTLCRSCNSKKGARP